nr:hypothetical protein [Streptomyces acidiscabies]
MSAGSGTFNLAVSPWVGYAADAAVVSYVAERKNLDKMTPRAAAEQ